MERSKMKLNFTDKFFVLCRPAAILTVVHFKTSHDIAEIRDAVRYLLTVYPKLRSIITPSLFSYELEILEEDSERLEALYNYAFRVIPNVKYNSKEYMELERFIFNEPFSLMTTLPVRFNFLPDGMCLIVLFSHSVGDGMSAIDMVCSLMSYLNNKKPVPEIPYDPGLLSMFNDHPVKWPIYFFKSLKQMIIDPDTMLGKSKGEVIQLSGKKITFQGICDLVHHEIPYDFTRIKALSKDMNTTISVILVTGLVMALCNIRKDKGDLVRIQVPISIRHNFKNPPTFGNHAYVAIINIFRTSCDNPHQLVGEVSAQFSKMMDIINNKKLLIPFLFSSLMSKIISHKTYLRIFNYTAKHRPFNFSLSFANLMNADRVNSFGNRAQASEVFFTTTQNEPFFDFHTLNDKFFLTCTYQENAYTREEINRLIKDFERSLGELLKLKRRTFDGGTK
jgi:hypothetical protein